MTIHQFEMSWIYKLQTALRGPFTDTFFIYWNYIDTLWFTLIFIAAIAYLFNRKEGISLLFILIISGIINAVLKIYFQLPRPCHLDPSVGILCSVNFGFPSGAAQTATIIAGVAFARCRRNSLKIVAGIFALLLCFSRIYLGLHFFTDILGGIGVGMGLLVIYFKLFPHLEKHWAKVGFSLSFLFFLIGGEKMFYQAGLLLGLAAGFLLSKNNLNSPKLTTRVLTFFVVALGSLLFVYLGEIYPFLKYPAIILAGFWFSYLGSYCCNRLKIL